MLILTSEGLRGLPQCLCLMQEKWKWKITMKKKSLVLQYFQVLPVKAFTVFPTVFPESLLTSLLFQWADCASRLCDHWFLYKYYIYPFNVVSGFVGFLTLSEDCFCYKGEKKRRIIRRRHPQWELVRSEHVQRREHVQWVSSGLSKSVISCQPTFLSFLQAAAYVASLP